MEKVTDSAQQKKKSTHKKLTKLPKKKEWKDSCVVSLNKNQTPEEADEIFFKMALERFPKD